MQLPQVQHSNPAQQQPQRTTPHSPATTTAPSTPSQQLQQRAHANPSQLQQHTRPQHQQNIRPSQHASGGVQQQHSSEQQLHSMGGPSPFQSQPPSVQSFQEQEMGGVAGPPRLAHGQPHVSHQQVVMGQRHSGHPPQQQQQQMLVGHHQTQQQHSTTMRIEQSGQVMHMHPAPPAPPHQPQRIYVQHSVPPLPPQSVQLPHEPPLHPPPPLPHLYIGSQRFASSIMAEMEVQPNVSPKQKYRDLKKKFKYLVYENEYYQEELRNLQRKLLKLSRDKNFLLDRLGQYEQLSESSDDSDASTKTLEERGVVKQKKKPKQAPNRKRAAPNSGGAPAGQPKRVGSKTTPAKSKETSREGTVLRLPQSQMKEELEQFGGENIAKQWDESLASPTMAQVQHQKQSDGREDSMESVDKVNETANCSFKLTNSLFSFKRISPSLSAKRKLTTDDGLDKASPPEKKQQIGLPVTTVVGDNGWEGVQQKLEEEGRPIAMHRMEENPSPSPASTSSSSSWHPFLCSLVEPTWQTLLDKEFKMEYIRAICSFLEEQDKKGVAVFPPRQLIFNAFNLTPFDKIRVVLIGQDPYHNLRQAHGLCFSVPNGEPMPPSLKNIFKELSSEFSDFTLPKHGTLTKWALQGVFLLNASLTVEAHKANSHAKIGWHQFTDAVIQLISAKSRFGVVFLLWGGFAHKKELLIDTQKHRIIKACPI
uniref:Uracil-DNA glycosylase-like domain-containing protein n=1 Tax=Globodera rostochiensis TaxID=31243 RepID=A0A914HAT5_GLORO